MTVHDSAAMGFALFTLQGWHSAAQGRSSAPWGSSGHSSASTLNTVMQFTGIVHSTYLARNRPKAVFCRCWVGAQAAQETLWTLVAVTGSPTWYIRGGPQTVASGVVTIQSATVQEGLEA